MAVPELNRWTENLKLKIQSCRTSLVAQWLRICLQIQGTWVPSLVQEDSTYRGASKPEYHNYWASNLQVMLHNKTSHCNERPVVDSAQTAWPPTSS